MKKNYWYFSLGQFFLYLPSIVLFVWLFFVRFIEDAFIYEVSSEVFYLFLKYIFGFVMSEIMFGLFVTFFLMFLWYSVGYVFVKDKLCFYHFAKNKNLMFFLEFLEPSLKNISKERYRKLCTETVISSKIRPILLGGIAGFILMMFGAVTILQESFSWEEHWLDVLKGVTLLFLGFVFVVSAIYGWLGRQSITFNQVGMLYKDKLYYWEKILNIEFGIGGASGKMEHSYDIMSFVYDGEKVEIAEPFLIEERKFRNLMRIYKE